MPPQVFKMIFCHKVMCGCEICISQSMMQCELSPWISKHIAKLISDYKRFHSMRSGKDRKKNEYINEVYPNGYHQYEIEIYVENSIYCIDIN